MKAGLATSANKFVTFDGGVVALDNYGRVLLGAAGPARSHRTRIGRTASFSAMSCATRVPRSAMSLADGADGSDVVMMAVPVTSDRGEMLGALVGMFRVGSKTTSPLYGSIIRQRAAPGVETILVDSQGVAIYHSDVDSIGQNARQTPAVAAVNSGATRRRARNRERRDGRRHEPRARARHPLGSRPRN